MLSSNHHMLRSLLSKSRSMGTTTKVGFIGLGNMGGPMAANLLKGGHSLVVNDGKKWKGGRG